MAFTRRTLLGALAGSGLAGAGWPATAAARPAQAERADPMAALWTGIELQGQDGRTFQMRDLRRPATLLHLWAHWCAACLGEMASLAAAVGRDTAVETVLVSHPQFWAADQAFARRHDLPFRLATLSAANDPGVAEAALLEGGTFVVPRSLLFAAAGRSTLWSHQGAVSWSSPATAAQLRTAAAG